MGKAKHTTQFFLRAVAANTPQFFRVGLNYLEEVKELEIPRDGCVVSFFNSDLALQGAVTQLLRAQRQSNQPIYAFKGMTGENVFASPRDTIDTTPYRLFSGPFLFELMAATVAASEQAGFYALELPARRFDSYGRLTPENEVQPITISTVRSVLGGFGRTQTDLGVGAETISHDRMVEARLGDQYRAQVCDYANFRKLLEQAVSYPTESLILGTPTRVWLNGIAALVAIGAFGVAVLAMMRWLEAERVVRNTVAIDQQLQQVRLQNAAFVMRNLGAFASAANLDAPRVLELAEKAWQPSTVVQVKADQSVAQVAVQAETARGSKDTNVILSDADLRDRFMAGRTVEGVQPEVTISNDGARLRAIYRFDVTRKGNVFAGEKTQ